MNHICPICFEDKDGPPKLLKVIERGSDSFLYRGHILIYCPGHLEYKRAHNLSWWSRWRARLKERLLRWCLAE